MRREHAALLHDTALADIDRAERANHRNAAGNIGISLCVRREAAETAAASNRLGEYFVRAQNSKTFFAQDANHRGKKTVIARERGAADARNQPRAFRIRAQIEQRRTTHGPHKDEILAAM